MSASRILVVRNDKLGDFMLAWPSFALLKKQWPEATLIALVPNYTADMARMCPWLDELLIDDGEGALALAEKLRRNNIDALCTLFSTTRVALAGWLAGIPYRLAPATKVAQVFYNHRLRQRRSHSEKPEYAYNLDLAYQLLSDHGQAAPRTTTQDSLGDFLPAELERPLLSPSSQLTRLQFAAGNALEPDARWVVIHPGSGGSANTLSARQYAQLAQHLTSSTPLLFIITAGPGEATRANELAALIRDAGGSATVLASGGLAALVEALRWADLFISGSTGPLHIAAALDRPTAAFYPRHRSATPLRWQTLNAPHKRLAFVPPADALADDVQSCDIDAAANAISALLTRSDR